MLLLIYWDGVFDWRFVNFLLQVESLIVEVRPNHASHRSAFRPKERTVANIRVDKAGITQARRNSIRLRTLAGLGLLLDLS